MCDLPDAVVAPASLATAAAAAAVDEGGHMPERHNFGSEVGSLGIRIITCAGLALLNLFLVHTGKILVTGTMRYPSKFGARHKAAQMLCFPNHLGS